MIIFWMMLFFFGILLPTIRANAATEDGRYAYLHFYTIDGEEIEELEKRVSKKRGYTFPNPNEYKYLPNDEELYPELYYEVNGILWEEKDEEGKAVGQYKEGEDLNWTAGEHFFFVKSDNPVLTGENILDLSYEEQAHIYFCNVNGEELYSLSADLSTKDEFTFPDPEKYAYRLEKSEDQEDWEDTESDHLTGKGIYWYCMDDHNKEYLFAKGDTCRFKAGEYYFYAKTDDPVKISFYYPLDVPTYFVTENTPGEFYASMEAKVGDTIYLKKSLGAVLWGCSFQGWDEMNRGNGKTYSGGSSYRVMDSMNLDFFAVYEEDDGWNPDAADENMTFEEINQEKEELIIDLEKINEAAGAGYGAYVDANGVLQRTGGKTPISKDVMILGIPGTIKKQAALSPLKAGVDISNPDCYKDPSNYMYDKYGNRIEDSKLEPEINHVLRQDDSAMYMDVYGNAFVYYSQLSRDANMKLAYERLTMGKTDSWVKNVSSWDVEVIKRFEAIEFALLKGIYPIEGEELAPGVIWKSAYMSKKAFDQLKSYKKLWGGWLDTYSDGLLEKYKENQGSQGNLVGKIHLPSFGFTAYADAKEEKNSKGQSSQIGSRILTSLDLENVKLKPQYYNPSTLYNFSVYSFSSLSSELNAEQIYVLKQIFQALVEYGFTEEAAAGACGNIWQECAFNPEITGGIVQWMGGRQANLLSFAGSKDWRDLSVQIGFMKQELNTSYLSSINKTLNRLDSGTTMSTVKNVQAACDAWCIAMEGCVCDPKGTFHKSHGNHCAISLGRSYQELLKRRSYSQKVYHAMVLQGNVIGGNFASMTPDEIIHSLFPNPDKPEKILQFLHISSTIKKNVGGCVHVTYR